MASLEWLETEKARLQAALRRIEADIVAYKQAEAARIEYARLLASKLNAITVDETKRPATVTPSQWNVLITLYNRMRRDIGHDDQQIAYVRFGGYSANERSAPALIKLGLIKVSDRSSGWHEIYDYYWLTPAGIDLLGSTTQADSKS